MRLGHFHLLCSIHTPNTQTSLPPPSLWREKGTGNEEDFIGFTHVDGLRED